MPLPRPASLRPEQNASRAWDSAWAGYGLAAAAVAAAALLTAALRIAFMNAVAERLTGWPLAEARARPLAEVFRIVNEETRGQVESPVEKVLREGQVVGLANHTVLVARDGAEVPVDDSGAP